MEKDWSSYKRATNRIKELKGFYRYIKIFVVVNFLLFLIKTGALRPLLPEGFPMEHYYFYWMDLNLLIWAMILMVHALFVFGNKLLWFTKWERQQIQKYLEMWEVKSKTI